MALEHNDFILEVIRPTKSVLITVTWVEVDGLTGSFLVGPGHSSLVSILKPGGVITYATPTGIMDTFEITEGIFSVDKGRAVILFER